MLTTEDAAWRGVLASIQAEPSPMFACSTTQPAGLRFGKSLPRRTIRHGALQPASPKRLRASARTPDAIACFGHGTTVATNALIQHRGARTGLITTDGFRDLLEIGRQKRPDLYDLMADKPVPLVSRDLRLEVPERLRHDGSIELALDEAAFRAAVRQLRAADVASGRGLLSVWLHQHRARSRRAPYSARGISRRLRLRSRTRSRRNSVSSNGCRRPWSTLISGR